MKKVIKLLEQELERQGILRMSNESEINKKKDFEKAGASYMGPPLYPESHLYEDEIREALKILKSKS